MPESPAGHSRRQVPLTPPVPINNIRSTLIQYYRTRPHGHSFRCAAFGPAAATVLSWDYPLPPEYGLRVRARLRSLSRSHSSSRTRSCSQRSRCACLSRSRSRSRHTPSVRTCCRPSCTGALCQTSEYTPGECVCVPVRVRAYGSGTAWRKAIQLDPDTTVTPIPASLPSADPPRCVCGDGSPHLQTSRPKQECQTATCSEQNTE